MVQCLLVALVGGWFMAQQPQPAPVVTQTELPPPGAHAAKPAPSAPADSTAKEPAPPPNKRTSDKKSAAQFVTPRQTVSEKKPPEWKKGKEPAPPLEEGNQSTGGRVAAFWIILPGK